MIVERSIDPDSRVNSYIVADRPGGSAVIIDTGASMGPLISAIDRLNLKVLRILCTHHHHDHVLFGAIWRERCACPLAGPMKERWSIADLDQELEGGEMIEVGGLRIRVLATPGHTVGHLAYHVEDHAVFCGDSLFRGSVAGTEAPGHGTFQELRHSILEVLMTLPPETPVWPGHADPTTIGDEWERNPFVRLWRGLDRETAHACTVGGESATLQLRATDYDGGTKCQVRFAANERLSIVPGSTVVELA